MKRENFKTCDQSGFCKRNRALADAAAKQSTTWRAPYELSSSTVKIEKGQLKGTILKTIGAGSLVELPAIIRFLRSGAVRLIVDEKSRQKKEIELRHGSIARKERYNEAADWTLVGGLEADESAIIDTKKSKDVIHVKYGPEGAYEATIKLRPFAIDFRRDGELHIQLNERGLFNVEHWRPKLEKSAEEAGQKSQDPNVSEDEGTWWEESFGGATDRKPRGPESVGIDITFPGYEHVMGIPEHASPLSLRETRGGAGQYTDPYRLYNADVFEYESDSPMTLYGAIPFMQAHKKDSSVGVFFLNAAEMWVDVIKTEHRANRLSLGIGSKTDTQTHWFSESGLLDIFVFLGPDPQALSKVYGELTGTTDMPQHFAIGYHQCRWNYVSQEDVKDVDARFDKAGLPYDVIWLDIEYTDDKKYFTWNPSTFSNPESMLAQLDTHGRKLVTIIDPHIKNKADYRVSQELQAKGLAMRNQAGTIYEGWCWPGSSHWVDCFNPATRLWLKVQYSYAAFKHTAANVFIWNDMNEPSVFNGPETTAPKDNLHHGLWEHRDVHNLYGLTFHNATHEALITRSKSEPPRRPFVLTRSFFAGSQRLGPMWTGDNQADWSHLKQSLPMVLTQGIAGFPFAGADVGGFFGNPSWPLFARWYQAGAFYPFFRGHAHIDARRREPYLAPEPQRSIVARALRLRYALLPTWYTAFFAAHAHGLPILRPMYYVFPADTAGFAIDDQFYVGDSGLLVKPVTDEGAESVEVYFADEAGVHYDYEDYTVYRGKGHRTVAAPPEKIPLFMRGGCVFARRDRPRRSSGLMKFDPFTLVAALDAQGDATGSLYHDDGESFDYRAGGFLLRNFAVSAKERSIVSEDISVDGEVGGAGGGRARRKAQAEYLKGVRTVKIERVVLVGVREKDWKGKKSVKVLPEKGPARQVDVLFEAGAGGRAAFVVIQNLGVPVGEGWKVDFS